LAVHQQRGSLAQRGAPKIIRAPIAFDRIRKSRHFD
jgi:hypothetical protein